MQAEIARSARGTGTFSALRQALGLSPLSVASFVRVVPFFLTEALMSSGCTDRPLGEFHVHYREPFAR